MSLVNLTGSPHLRSFAAIGVVNTAIDLALFTTLHGMLGIVMANLVSTSAGMGFSFLANGHFTFGHRRPSWRRAARFVATTGATMWVLQPLLIVALTEVGSSAVAAKLGALGVSVAVNYAAYRWIVWRPEVSPGPLPAGRVAAPVAARR